MSNKVETPFHHSISCFYSIAKTYIYIYIYIYRMREEISCRGDKEAIQLEGSLLHNHKQLLPGIKCLAVNCLQKDFRTC